MKITKVTQSQKEKFYILFLICGSYLQIFRYKHITWSNLKKKNMKSEKWPWEMSSQDRNSSIQINEARNGEKREAWIWREERQHGRVGKREEQITLFLKKAMGNHIIRVQHNVCTQFKNFILPSRAICCLTKASVLGTKNFLEGHCSGESNRPPKQYRLMLLPLVICRKLKLSP